MWIRSCTYPIWILLLGIAACTSTDTDHSAKDDESIHNDSVVRNMGDLFYDPAKPIDTEFTIANFEGVPMTLKIIDSTCGCVSAGINGQSGATIAPGDHAVLKVRIEPENRFMPEYTQSVQVRTTYTEGLLPGDVHDYQVKANILPKFALASPSRLPLVLSEGGQGTLYFHVFQSSNNVDTQPLVEVYSRGINLEFSSKSVGSIRHGNAIGSLIRLDILVHSLHEMKPDSEIEVLANEQTILIELQRMVPTFSLHPKSVFINNPSIVHRKTVKIENPDNIELTAITFDKELVSVVVNLDSEERPFVEIENAVNERPFKTEIEIHSKGYTEPVGRITVSAF